MTGPVDPVAPRPLGRSWPASWWAAGLLVLVIAVAYANSFSGAFVLDDEKAVLGNPTIRRLWPPWSALAPPAGEGLTVEGRPLVNLSLAVNYALSGLGAGSYHAANLAVHILAALVLFGLVRRTAWRGGPPRPAVHDGGTESDAGPTATGLAFVIALLWAVHPLQTESVTYIVQRTESLMGLLYLGTLYAFARAAQTERATAWWAVSVASCALGMATKEVMVSAPLMVLFYDRTFVAGSFRAAWTCRRRYYLALAATWLLLAVLVIGAGDRGGTIGPKAGIEWWQYALTQSRAVMHYASLALWPRPLIFDYGADFVTWQQALPYLLGDFALLTLTVVALWRRPMLGFLGAWYFMILAPTSSVLGGTRQMLAEHRMYLSLAAIVTLVVVGSWRWLGRRAWLAWAGLAWALAFVTVRRNEDYRSERVLYADTVAKRPDNVHARYNLGKVLAEAGDWTAAVEQDAAAVRLAPELANARYNLANALEQIGRPAEARAQYEAAIAIKPDYAKAHFNLGNLLVQLGRKTEAAEHFRAAVKSAPDYLEARDNLGSVLLDLGQLEAARAAYLQVLRLNPNLAETHCNLGAVAYLQGRYAEAIAEYERALRLDPRFRPAQEGLARTRRAAGE